MEFDSEKFVEEITWEKFDELRKPDLMKLARHLKLEARHSMRKQDIKNALIETLVQEEIFDESYLEKIQEIQDDGTSDAVKLKQLEVKKELEMKRIEMQMQIEKEKLEIVKQQQEIEKELKQKELEAKNGT